MSSILFNPSSLSVSNTLHDLLRTKINEQQLAESRCSYFIFNFRDSSYSAEQGGYHPVEIAITQSDDGNWIIEYITDFAYVGSQYPELERCLDFDFSDQAFFAQYSGWKPIKGSAAAIELYRLWEENFLCYVDMDAYDDISLNPQ